MKKVIIGLILLPSISTYALELSVCTAFCRTIKRLDDGTLKAHIKSLSAISTNVSDAKEKLKILCIKEGTKFKYPNTFLSPSLVMKENGELELNFSKEATISCDSL